MSPAERAEILTASVGERTNRRHKPGRSWERTQYRFDVVCDYGAFRDLQRHRPLTIEWQRLTTEHGYETPTQIDDARLRADWERVMAASAEVEHALIDAGLPHVAQYAVSMAYRIRFVMQMTAREAMHLTELRSQPAGHPVYRRVAQAMHRLIAEVHPAIGEAFGYVSYDAVDLERLEAERRTEAKRKALRPSS
jgi:thymidylate synthase ThyX